MNYRILIVDDYEDMRDLLEFVVTSELRHHCETADSGNKAIEKMRSHGPYDLIISDLNMPDGTGVDVYNAYKNMGLTAPFIVLSGEPIDNHPAFKSSPVERLAKPFELQDVINKVNETLGATSTQVNTYLPVSTLLLRKLEQIDIPLFVKINESKFVRLTSGPSLFKDEDLQKYRDKNIHYLYIDSQNADELIGEYRKKVLSSAAWNETEPPAHDLVSINTELLKSLSQLLGWNQNTVDLAKRSINKCLILAKNHSGMGPLLQRFHQIERYGFADRCTLTLLIATSIAKGMGFADESTLASLSFASIFHDMTLADSIYDQKDKWIKQMLEGAPDRKEFVQIRQHPLDAAEIVKQWDFCPHGVDQIIINHHERPDGSGFPMKKTFSNLDFLSSTFIVAEDFSNYFIAHHGKVDVAQYVESRTELFSKGHFKSALREIGASTLS